MASDETVKVLLRYPFVGEIRRVTDRGFGFVTTSRGEYFIHLRDHSGQRLDTMEGLEGKLCAFVVGGHPFRWAEQRPDWNRAVVEWRLLNDFDGPETTEEFEARRADELAALDMAGLREVLSARWYVKQWRKRTGSNPQAILKADSVLDACLSERLSLAADAEELIQLLAAICESPWYCVREEGRAAVCERFFNPSAWSASVFVARGPLKSFQGYATLEPYCGETLQGYVHKAKVVAIDIESDGETIFEFGWRNALGKGAYRSQEGLSVEELRAAVDECLAGQPEPCIVGHNLFAWDWPILQKREASLPESSALWDTLIASWILEPWRDSHALVVAEGAHTADADAAACYELFERQIESLGDCLDGKPAATVELVERIYENPQLLSAIGDRHYPTGLVEALPGATVFPSCRAAEFAWQRGCRVHLLAPENKLADPILGPDCCRAVAERESSISAKAVTAVVTDARSQDVYVRLSDIPVWLVDDNLRALLRGAHEGRETDDAGDAVAIYLAEDLFSLSEDEVDRLFGDGILAVSHAQDVALAWQEARCRRLTEVDVRAEFPGVAEGRSGRALLPVRRPDGDTAWLLHVPPGLNADSASWFLLPSVPPWLRIESSPNPPEAISLARIPRWRDGDALRLDVDRLFVSPDTANRPLYLADLTHCILSLLRSRPEDEILVVGVRWPEEAAQLQRNLAQLGVSAEHPGTPLRRLESICGKGMRVLVCARDELPKYVEAAIRLGRDIQVALDEVPLHEWYAIHNAPTAPRPNQEDADLPDPASEDEEREGSPDGDTEHSVGIQAVLRGRDIRVLTDSFLQGWLERLGMSASAGVKPCLILDARIALHDAARATRIQREDIPFYSLEELLDEDVLRVFYDICYPRREAQEAANDYESYRAFLQEAWGYDDFRPGTQKPAIEKLIQTNHDMLLRLPTGGGKSIVFHLPALLRSNYSGRLTVVITPLRALMRDQVEGLWRRHFTESVDYLSGGRDAWLNHEVYQGVLDGRIRLVFVAPERFRVPRFTEALERRRRMDGGLEFVVFDEAHCISEWGFEFRPDYLYAADYVANWFKKKDLPGNPHRLLLTSATVTQRNRVDLERELALGKPGDYDDLPEDMPHPIQSFITLESFDLDEDEDVLDGEKFEKICEILGELDLEKSAALVFVRRRKDCHLISEALNARAAQPDSGLAALRALPFHAGLPEAVKTEACDLLHDRNVNVLVCTKAFGMGMDIPHLHACIHHRPPTFIEDYLQEVGRIGRDEEERLRVGRELVTASLLYNQKDIERNLGLLHSKSVMPPDLQDFFDYCRENSVFFGAVGKSLCLVPAKVRISEAKSFDENQVSTCLFWLERMGVLRIEGRNPPFLDLTLDVSRLHSHAKGTSHASRIAAVLLDLVTESHGVVKDLAGVTTQDAALPQMESVFARVTKGLLRGVLALIPPSTSFEALAQNHSGRLAATTYGWPRGHETVEVSLSMSELMSGCGGIGMDDLFAGLFELCKADVLSVRKNLTILPNGLPSGDEFFGLLETAVQRLLEPTGEKVEYLDRKALESELQEYYRQVLIREYRADGRADGRVALSHVETLRLKSEVRRAISTSLKLLRYAGVELRERLSESGVPQYARFVAESRQASAVSSASESMNTMRQLLGYLSSVEAKSSVASGGAFEVGLTDIIDALGGDIRIGRLKEIIKLVETAGFYGVEGEFDGWVSLVTLNTQEQLPPPADDSDGVDAVQRVYVEMREKHRLQVLRAHAMVLLSVMPAENRREYIDRYFESESADDLERLLEDTVGDVDDEVIADNRLLQGLLSQVRQERFTEELERLNDRQRAVCTAPFNQTLLVNAGPGSGKTHLLMMRCAHLIHSQGVSPSEILVLAFNRAVVYEIRDRIRGLFRALGYGSYANRLDVTTFHSFALRNQRDTELYEEDAIGEAVHRFADKMKSDDVFAAAIGSRYKAVLVDEFQDMNEDFYDVVKTLFSTCRGGGMVIGDDDQDILTWNRRDWQRKHGRDCPLDATHYFSDFRQTLQPVEHHLTLNYRSVSEIVKRANGMIQRAADQVGFSRVKAGVELAASRPDDGIVQMPFDSGDSLALVAQSLGSGESVAVLCRSNRECRQHYEELVQAEGLPRERIELLGSEDFPLYQLRHCGALLDICRTRKDHDFVESYAWEELIAEFAEQDLADREEGLAYLDMLYALLREEAGRPRVRDLRSFMGEMRGSDIERLKAKAGLGEMERKLTIATIHKVKGLEYDTVLIVPSVEGFPFSGGNGQQPGAIDAAEEARLYYVAMTRARSRLYGGWADRENAWWRRRAYAGAEDARRFHLRGSPKECFVSWPGQRDQVRGGLQSYIGRHVRLGDPLELRGGALLHDGRPVGRLSSSATTSLQQANAKPQLRVSNVIRYTCGNYFREHNAQFWENLDDAVKRQGWFYLVLAEEA